MHKKYIYIVTLFKLNSNVGILIRMNIILKYLRKVLNLSHCLKLLFSSLKLSSNLWPMEVIQSVHPVFFINSASR